MYGEAAGLAALAALYPPALLIGAVYLSSASPRKLALLFVAGAVLMTAVAGIVVLVALRAGGLSLPANRPPRYGLRVGLGVLALAAASYLTWRNHRRLPADPAKPGKPSRISRMTANPRPRTALAVGLVLFMPGVGFIAAVQVIATAKASVAATATALVMVVVIDVAFAWLPPVAYLIFPRATTRALKAVNAWLGKHGRVLLAGSLGAIGAILLISGGIGLV
jgi:Sap, sulfolipid-1-addressing protein